MDYLPQVTKYKFFFLPSGLILVKGVGCRYFNAVLLDWGKWVAQYNPPGKKINKISL
jgi:hypothetical protein